MPPSDEGAIGKTANFISEIYIYLNLRCDVNIVRITTLYFIHKSRPADIIINKNERRKNYVSNRYKHL